MASRSGPGAKFRHGPPARQRDEDCSGSHCGVWPPRTGSKGGRGYVGRAGFEYRDVTALGDIDANSGGAAFVGVVIIQAFAKLSGFDSYDGVWGRSRRSGRTLRCRARFP